LILLNGAPASGKSTLAERFCATHHMTLNLDIDVIRGLIGGWIADPHESGIAARQLAVAMATTHLRAGHDVIVPQFLGRLEFIERLEATANDADAEFIEVALIVDRSTATDAFEQRRLEPESPRHLDAAALVEQSADPDPVGTMFDAFMRTIEQRGATRHVAVIRGDIAATNDALELAVAQPSSKS
jgi:predicted kinase